MDQEIEQTLICPYCGAIISVLLDASVNQQYIEDCEVCCKPILIRYSIEDGSVMEFEALREDD